MKKFAIFFLLFFFCLAFIYALFQSELGKNWIKTQIISSLEKTGFSIKIDQIEGALPSKIDLVGVEIQKEDLILTIERIRLKPVIWRLFKKEIAFNQVDGKNISFQKSPPFDFQGKLRFNANQMVLKGSALDIKVKALLNMQTKRLIFSGENQDLSLNGSAFFNPDYSFASSDFTFQYFNIPSGAFSGSGHVWEEKSRILCKLLWDLEIKKEKITGEAHASYQEGALKGVLSGPFSKVDVDLQLDNRIKGTVDVDLENLGALPIQKMYGAVQIKAIFDENKSQQTLFVEAKADHLYYEELFVEKLLLKYDFIDPFHSLLGTIDLKGENLTFQELKLNDFEFFSVNGKEEHPFDLKATGFYKSSFDLHALGTWKEGLFIKLKEANGFYFQTPFALSSAVHMQFSENEIQIPPLRALIGEGELFLQVSQKKNDLDANLKLYFPSPVGTLSLDGFLKGKDRIKGAFEGNLEGIDGTRWLFSGKLEKDLLTLNTQFLIDQTPFAQGELFFPIELRISPFEVKPFLHKEMKGKISLNGRIEKILDLLDLSIHNLEGDCLGEISFRNTFYRPLVEGKIVLKNGFYENYYSGMQMKEIEAEIIAEKNSLFLRSFKGIDEPGGGKFQAQGEMQLLYADSYPFRVDAQFQSFQFAQIDLVNASASGKVLIEGNQYSSLAKGEITIDQCILTIPDHISNSLPELQVVYRNPIHPPENSPEEKKSYPIHLNIHLSAPANIVIQGRGLESRWSGDFVLGGTYTNLALGGKLDLMEGEFNFSSRTFRLTEGSLYLSGKEQEMPLINLAGTIETKGIVITARLAGPLDNPQLTLLSNPPLPLGSIMSHLLFGQDISEISGFDALQLAASLASLAGTGSDVMESTRKSLGVDRLRIVSDPTSSGGETAALQVGKYISKGVLVSFTQGAEQSNTNISVEVEIKGNFILQIESDQSQEQGKFTLKWNLNY